MWDYTAVRVGIITSWFGEYGHVTPVDSPSHDLVLYLHDRKEPHSDSVEVVWRDPRIPTHLKTPCIGEKIVFELIDPTGDMFWGYMRPYYKAWIEVDRRRFRIIDGNVVAWQGYCSFPYSTPLVTESRQPFPDQLARTSYIEELVPSWKPADEFVGNPTWQWRHVTDRTAMWNRLLEASANPFENSFTPPPLRGVCV